MGRIRYRKPLRREVKEAVYAKTNGLCWYCGYEVSDKPESHFSRANIDHVVPVSKGGTDDLTNLVPSCFQCNITKGTQTLEEFRKEESEKAISRCSWGLERFVGVHRFCSNELEESVALYLKRLEDYAPKYRVVFYGETIGLTPDEYVI